MKKMQSGFTLIELIMVIVILGALAVVALPRYVNLQAQAQVASANGVLGAAQSAAAINYAAGLTGATAPVPAGISTGANLLAAMNPAPAGWIPNGNAISWDIDGSGVIDAPDNQNAGNPFTITVTTAEVVGTSAAVITSNF